MVDPNGLSDGYVDAYDAVMGPALERYIDAKSGRGDRGRQAGGGNNDRRGGGYDDRRGGGGQERRDDAYRGRYGPGR